jgi:hypothetical protein
MTPFRALHGRLPPSIPLYNESLTSVHEVDHQLISRDELLRQLKANLAKSMNRMKQIADQKRRDIMFQIGDWVLLKLHPYCQQIVFKRVHQKLATRYYGPYKIVDKIGLVAYRLQLLEEARIHPVFHVSLLKRYQTKEGIVEPRLIDIPPVIADEELILEPQTILDYRWLKQRKHLVAESLVQWKHLPAEDATWEPTN